jgi:hypothetical protein
MSLRPRVRTTGHRARAIAALGSLAAAIAAGAPGCDGDEAGGCPAATEDLTAAEVDVYRQLEACASRVTGVSLRRDDLPRVESDPTLVECDGVGTQCVATAAGQAVAGFYLEGCDTFTVARREVLLHEMLHPILCGVPELECDGGHTSPAWIECQDFERCPDGRIILDELVCDGTAHCAQGEDELGCE